MTTFTTPVTLNEAARAGNMTAVDAALIETFLPNQTSRPGMEQTFLAAFPWKDLPGSLSFEFTRELALPTITPRGLNETVTRSVGSSETIKESMKIYAAEFMIDEAMLRTDAGRVAFARQASMHAKAVLSTVQNHLFKGDESTSAHQITGLQARATGDYLISEGSTNGGDPLQIATLRQAIDAVYGENRVIVCGKALARRLDAAIGLSGVGASIQDGVTQWGMKARFFDGIPIIPVCDLDGADNVLQFNEVGAGGATATATSLYVISLGENGVHGIRNGGLTSRELPSGAAGEQALKGSLLWLGGMASRRKNACARIYGISNAAVIA